VVRLVKLLSMSAAETARMGEQLGGLLVAGDTVALTGTLGSGKSVLARGIMTGLGVTARMPSPSFVIVASYEGRHPVNHIDLYRLEKPEDAIAVGIEDMLYSDAVNIIEWAERLGAELPPSRIDVLLELRDDPEERLVTLVPSDDRVGTRLLPLVRQSAWIDRGGRPGAGPGPEDSPGDVGR
jgi:tRNA threonylcarbamoyladenosine biosynthesis protein TsaE